MAFAASSGTGKHKNQWEELKATFGTENETLELVSEILADVEGCGELQPLYGCTKPEGWKLILEKTKGLGANHRAVKLASIISERVGWATSEEDNEMIRLGLGELATCGWQPFQAIHLVYYPREYFRYLQGLR